MGSIARRISKEVVDELSDRSGFAIWYGQMDDEIKEKFKGAVEKDVDDLLDPIRVQFTELVQYVVDNGGVLRSHHNFWIKVNELKEMLEK
jgi:hypothetical protein